MAKHRTHSVEFKRQVSKEYLAGETLHGLSKRHDISRNLIGIWVEKYQAGALDEDAAAADLLQTYEARIAALERLVGRQALELEFLKGLFGQNHGREAEPHPLSQAKSISVARTDPQTQHSHATAPAGPADTEVVADDLLPGLAADVGGARKRWNAHLLLAMSGIGYGCIRDQRGDGRDV